MNKTAKIFAFVFWSIGTGLYLTAMLTDYWVAGDLKERYGLFKACTPLLGCREFGWDIHPGQDIFLAIFLPRILMLLGAGMVVMGVLTGLIGICTNESCPLITEGVFEVIGGLSMLAACGTFTSQNMTAIAILGNTIQIEAFHYSYYFGWISGGMFILAGFCSMCSASKSYSY